MISNRLHVYIKFMVGFVAMFVFVPAQGENVNGNGLLTQQGPFAEVVYVDIGPDETIECTAADYGYALLDEEDNGAEILPESDTVPQIVIEPPGIRVFRFTEYGLPQIIAEVSFDEDALGLNGHDYVAAGPFSTTPPPEQIVTLNNDMGETEVLLLENTYDPDLNIDCTVFMVDPEYTEGYYLDTTTGQAVKKKAVKRKVAKANKRKVHKKKAKRKAAVKRKKATKRKATTG